MPAGLAFAALLLQQLQTSALQPSALLQHAAAPTRALVARRATAGAAAKAAEATETARSAAVGSAARAAATAAADAAKEARSAKTANAFRYADYWERLLVQEHEEAAESERKRRATWPPRRLEDRGFSLFSAAATPDTELWGEKVVRIRRTVADVAISDLWHRGDTATLTLEDDGRSLKPERTRGPQVRAADFAPRECVIIDAGADWLTVGVGNTWPNGLWEARRTPGSFRVRLDRITPNRGPLDAQRSALRALGKGTAGDAADLLAASMRTDGALRAASPSSDEASAEEAAASLLPARFEKGVFEAVWQSGSRRTPARQTQPFDSAVRAAVSGALADAPVKFDANPSQVESISWALGRRAALVRGPPGTGKTRVAAVLIAAALRLRGASGEATRVLAVAHSNGAADVLLEALIDMGVPAIRAGRPASVSPAARRRTSAAMAERHPEVLSLRAKASNASLTPEVRAEASVRIFSVVDEIRAVIVSSAPVVVASCVGSANLGDEAADGLKFPIVVLDEAAQTTEPALMVALVAARAEQVVLVGDTKQLPPTVPSEDRFLRENLGHSPMARLENCAISKKTLTVQYRMPPELLDHPSRYFYDGVVTCADTAVFQDPPRGFPWPSPLAFVHVGGDLEVANGDGGKSNPTEAALVGEIVRSMLLAGDVSAEDVVVLAPYSLQVDRIQQALASRRLNVRVSTVDAFQGREAEVVLFSATRSNAYGELGFLQDARRLCVALTRARRGLIVVGDADTLQKSRHWRALLESCRSRGCVLGADQVLLDAGPAEPPLQDARMLEGSLADLDLS